MTWRDKAKANWDPAVAIECYNEQEGDRGHYRYHMREKYKAMGLDPMTIMMLVRMAIMLYFWAKEKGFLSSITEGQAVGAPSADALLAGADEMVLKGLEHELE